MYEPRHGTCGLIRDPRPRHRRFVAHFCGGTLLGNGRGHLRLLHLIANCCAKRSAFILAARSTGAAAAHRGRSLRLSPSLYFASLTHPPPAGARHQHFRALETLNFQMHRAQGHADGDLSQLLALRGDSCVRRYVGLASTCVGRPTSAWPSVTRRTTTSGRSRPCGGLGCGFDRIGWVGVWRRRALRRPHGQLSARAPTRGVRR